MEHNLQRLTKLLPLYSIALSACSKDDVTNNPNQPDSGDDSNEEWLIPRNLVLDGGPGKDGIPALQNIEFIRTSPSAYVLDNDLVLGYVYKDVVRAYPHNILNWHEIINDNLDDLSMAVIYCPLTGTGIGWNRVLNGVTLNFTPLQDSFPAIMVDNEGTSWDAFGKGVSGPRAGERLEKEVQFIGYWFAWAGFYPNIELYAN